MANAQSYWGIAHANPATCKTTASTTTATCNGDGNGLVDHTVASSSEVFRFWQHLANAGLIEGSYDSITHGSTNFAATAANSPAGKISSSYWYTANFDTQSAQAALFDATYNNSFQLGAIMADLNPRGVLLKAEEAYNVDAKTDDGKPATGRVVVRDVLGFGGNRCTNAANSTVLNADYMLSNSAITCALLWPQAF